MFTVMNAPRRMGLVPSKFENELRKPRRVKKPGRVVGSSSTRVSWLP
jgi:hypothetical protein